MDNAAIGLDWAQARAFLAAAETGSFSAAARRMGVTQPTVSRQIAALEADFGITLFERTGRSLAITPTGAALLEHARAMGAAAQAFDLAASGRNEAVGGLVRISATELTAAYRLPPILVDLRAAAPKIEITVVADDAISDLRRREADIAIRHIRPDQPDFIARRMPDIPAHLYAARAYLDRVGRPRGVDDLAHIDVLAHAEPRAVMAMYGHLGMRIAREQLRCGAENGVALLGMLRAGLGAMMMPEDAALIAPELERVLPDMPAVPVPVWLVTHRELHTSRKIRIVFDALADALGRPFTP